MPGNRHTRRKDARDGSSYDGRGDPSRETVDDAWKHSQISAYRKLGKPLSKELQGFVDADLASKEAIKQVRANDRKVRISEKALDQLRSDLGSRFGEDFSAALKSPGCLAIADILESEKA